MPHQNINGTNYYYHESGRGIPLVLLHGFPLDHRVWRHQAHDLAGVCRVITPDLRGFGQSADNHPFTIHSLAEDVYVLLSQIHALPCVLAGLSLGGYVALDYERHYASTLRGLMLVDTRPNADSAEGRAARETMIELAKSQGAAAVAEKMMPRMLAGGAESGRPEVVAELNTMMHNCPVNTIQHALAAMRDRPDSTPTLSHIAAPTLIICGEADELAPPAVSQEMHRAIRGSTLSIVTGAGHMAPLEQPQQVSRTMRHFLATLSK